MASFSRFFSGNYIPLLACFYAPAVGGIIRKFTPGQPNSIEPGITVLSMLGVWLFVMAKKNWQVRSMPVWLFRPLWLWILLILIYTIPALFISIPMTGMVGAIRFLPIGMALMACRTIKTRDDLRKIAQYLGYLILILLPFGIIVAVLGNNVLPPFLRPIEKFTEIGRDQKGGFDTCALIFNVEQTLAISVMTVEYLCLAVMQYDKTRTRFYWAVNIASIILLFVSTQRGVFYAGLIGTCVHFLIQKGSKKRLTIGVFVVTLLVISIIDKYSHAESRYSHYDSRTELMTNIDPMNRITNIFWNISVYWMKTTPTGTFMGYAGLESLTFAPAFAAPRNIVIETGLAQLIAETGIFGAVIFPLVVALLIFAMLKKSKYLACRQSIVMLSTFVASFFILFYMKICGFMMTMTMGQLAFWAFPGVAAALIAIDKKDIKNKINQKNSIQGMSSAVF